ncbi:MAG: phosphodiesterase, partial [Chloroflexi bacterium]
HGIFMAAGPVITPSREPLEKLSLQDIAPTVLYLLGLPVPSDMDGRVILEMVSPHFRDAHPVTYGEPGRFWGEDLMETTTTGFSAEDEALLRERLSALGYLE